MGGLGVFCFNSTKKKLDFQNHYVRQLKFMNFPKRLMQLSWIFLRAFHLPKHKIKLQIYKISLKCCSSIFSITFFLLIRCFTLVVLVKLFFQKATFLVGIFFHTTKKTTLFFHSVFVFPFSKKKSHCNFVVAH